MDHELDEYSRSNFSQEKLTPEILLRDDVILISKLGSLLMTISKQTKRINNFQYESEVIQSNTKVNIVNDREATFRVKYLLLTEKFLTTLINKKHKINNHIMELKKNQGRSYIGYEKGKAIQRGKKLFSKYDESLDQMAEEIFETERLYTNEQNELKQIFVEIKAARNTSIATDSSEKNQNNKFTRCSSDQNFKESVKNHIEFEKEMFAEYFGRRDWDKFKEQSNRLNTDNHIRSPARSKGKSWKNAGSFISFASRNDKDKMNNLKSRSVYKEETQEFGRKMNKIFKKYNIRDSVIASRVNQLRTTDNTNCTIDMSVEEEQTYQMNTTD